MYAHLFKDLRPTVAEYKLIEATARGVPADFQTCNAEQDDPATAEAWGDERTVRAEVIFALLVEGRSDWPVHPQGVWVKGAKIVGALDLSHAELAAPLGLFACRLDSNLALRDCRAKSLALSGSHVAGISGDGLTVAGSLYLRDGFTSKGGVRFLGATISSNFECSAARFENDAGAALNADGLDVKGSVFLRKCTAKGEVRFIGATVGGDFACSEATFGQDKDDAPNTNDPAITAYALSADGLEVEGSVFLRKCIARGEVRFLDATVGGTFDCLEATFENDKGIALYGDGLDVKGSVFLAGCTARGEVRFIRATMRGDFVCLGATFINPDGDALALERTKISQTIHLTFAEPPTGGVNLTHASSGQLVDTRDAWPAAGDLILDGFEYGAFAGDAPAGWEDRLRWLKLQGETHLKADFRPQPWEQVVAVLRRMGHDADARKIAIAKQDALLKSGLRSRWWSRLWHGFLGETIKYGYESWRALIWMAVIILIGTVIFRDADRADLIVPAKERVYLDHRYEATQGKWLPPEYPSFAPLVFAADVFVPILDLHQETHWRPATSKGVWGWAVTIFMWFYILLGWVFTTLAVAGLTGLVRQRAEQ